MDANFSHLAAWSYGLAAAGFAVFAVQLAIGWRGNQRALVLLVAILSSCGWAGAGVAYALSESTLMLGFAAAADLGRQAAWFAFLLLLILRAGRDPGLAKTLIRPTWLVSVAVALISAGTLAHVVDWFELGDPVGTRRYGLLISLSCAVFGLVLVEQLYRNVPAGFRWGVKPMCLGLAATWLFDLYLYTEAFMFSRVDADVWSVRGAVHALAIPLVAVSTVRNRDWTFEIAVSRHVAFHSAALLGSGLYLLLIAGAGYYVRFFGGDWGRALQTVFVFAALLLLVALLFSGSMRAKLRVLLNKHFFSYRYDYREEWLKLTHTLAARGTQEEVRRSVIRGLADLVESPGGWLWLRDDAGRFAPADHMNGPAVSELEPADGGLARFLRETGWVVDLGEYRSTQGRYQDLDVPAWLGELPDAWLVVPLSMDEDLLGFVVLATARAQIEIDWEVRDLLKTAGRQAASFLGQMMATEALLDAKKFESFNRMSAFVVHDLKNLVAQLSLMLKNAERHGANPEFQKDMLDTVGHVTERMRLLMLQLREGTIPVEAPRGVDLAAVLGRVLKSKAGSAPPVEMRSTQAILVSGHAERLERCIGHLVQNAIDATGSEGRVWVKLERADGKALLEVGDSGHGMTQEFVRERLFRPFESTKATGMGIGAYESFNYVRELGGEVSVDTAPGKGTRVHLLLPLAARQEIDEAA
jgi:putative PEP-CTERM system histidine kinase